MKDIDKLIERLEALEQRVFGNTEQAQFAPEPKTETVYDGVFYFEGSGKANCINGNQVMFYSQSDDTWLILSSADLPKHRHRLVPVNEFTVGKFYAREGGDLHTPFGYSMYLGDDRFVAWDDSLRFPIDLNPEFLLNNQLLEVHPA